MDASTIYDVPLLMLKEKQLDQTVLTQLKLSHTKNEPDTWISWKDFLGPVEKPNMPK
jgi:CTP synthase